MFGMRFTLFKVISINQLQYMLKQKEYPKKKSSQMLEISLGLHNWRFLYLRLKNLHKRQLSTRFITNTSTWDLTKFQIVMFCATISFQFNYTVDEKKNMKVNTPQFIYLTAG